MCEKLSYLVMNPSFVSCVLLALVAEGYSSYQVKGKNASQSTAQRIILQQFTPALKSLLEMMVNTIFAK